MSVTAYMKQSEKLWTSWMSAVKAVITIHPPSVVTRFVVQYPPHRLNSVSPTIRSFVTSTMLLKNSFKITSSKNDEVWDDSVQNFIILEKVLPKSSFRIHRKFGDPLKPRYRQRFFNYIYSDVNFASSIYQGRIQSGFSNFFDHDDEKRAFLNVFASEGHLQKLIGNPENYPCEIARFEDQSHAVLPVLDVDSALRLADIWYYISQYDKSVPAFHRDFLLKLEMIKDLRPHQALQVLLYCAAYRKITPEVETLLKSVILDNADKFSLLDFELLAFSSYILKLDFRHHAHFLCDVASALLNSDTRSVSVAVTILKFLRQNGFVVPEYFLRFSKELSNYVLDEANGVECCHILYAFSSAKFWDEPLVRRLEKVIVECLRNQLALYSPPVLKTLLYLHPSERLRGKDIAGYLHSMAVLNVEISCVQLIFEDLRNRRKVMEFFDAPHLLAQSLYALSLQGHYDLGLLTAVFSRDSVWKLRQAGQKDGQRWLYCLYKNCQLEFSDSLDCFNVDLDKLALGLPREFNSSAFEMSRRDKDVVDLLAKSLQMLYGFEAVKWTRLLPHLEISGFEIRTVSPGNVINALRTGNTKVLSSEAPSTGLAIEIMDDWTCAANDHSKLLGLTVSKIRLLKSLGYSVKTVNQVTIRRCLETENPVETLVTELRQQEKA